MDTIYPQKQKINYKMINQIKLLIKPSHKIQIITHSFLSLLGGTISYIPYSLPKSDWNYLKGLIKNPNEIIEIVNNTDTFIKRVRFENLNKSLQIIQKLSDLQETKEIQPDELFEVLFATTKHLQNIAKPLFKNLLPIRKINGSSSQQKQTDSSFSSLQRPSQKQNSRGQIKKTQTKKVENNNINKRQQSLRQSTLRQSTVGSQKSIQTQFSQNKIMVSQRSISQQSNRKLQTSSISRLSTPKSRTSISSDISFRVLQAQLKKQTRLDKILKLNTKKPKVQSTIKTQMCSNNKYSRQQSPSNSIRLSNNRDRITSTHLRNH